MFQPGFIGALFAISSNNIAIGFLDNEPAVISGTGSLQEDGLAADLTKNFLDPVVITNTVVQPY